MWVCEIVSHIYTYTPISTFKVTGHDWAWLGTGSDWPWLGVTDFFLPVLAPFGHFWQLWATFANFRRFLPIFCPCFRPVLALFVAIDRFWSFLPLFCPVLNFFGCFWTLWVIFSYFWLCAPFSHFFLCFWNQKVSKGNQKQQKGGQKWTKAAKRCPVKSSIFAFLHCIFWRVLLHVTPPPARKYLEE